MSDNSVFVVLGESGGDVDYQYKLLSAHMDKKDAESEAASKRSLYEQCLKAEKSMHEIYSSNLVYDINLREKVVDIIKNLSSKEKWERVCISEVPIKKSSFEHEKLNFVFSHDEFPILLYKSADINYTICPNGSAFEAVYNGWSILYCGSLYECLDACNDHYNRNKFNKLSV